MTALKVILIVDKTRKMLYFDALKSNPLICKNHRSYLWLKAGTSSLLYCKKGKHSIAYDADKIELVEL